MTEFFVPRSSEFVLELTLLPGKHVSDGGPAVLHLGKLGSSRLHLAPAYFRILVLLGLADAEDELHGLPDVYRGFRSTEVIARAYADQVNHRHAPLNDTVIAYMKKIRDTIGKAALELASQHELPLPKRPLAVEHTGDGYRIGEISLRVLDYRTPGASLGAPTSPPSPQ